MGVLITKAKRESRNLRGKITCVIFHFSGRKVVFSCHVIWAYVLAFCCCSFLILFVASSCSWISLQEQYEDLKVSHNYLKRQLLESQFKEQVSFSNLYYPVYLKNSMVFSRDSSELGLNEKLETLTDIDPWDSFNDSFDELYVDASSFLHIRRIALKRTAQAVTFSFEIVNKGKKKPLEGYVWGYLVKKDLDGVRIFSFPKGVAKSSDSFFPSNIEKAHQFKVKNYASISLQSTFVEQEEKFDGLFIFAVSKEKKFIFKQKKKVDFVKSKKKRSDEMG